MLFFLLVVSLSLAKILQIIRKFPTQQNSYFYILLILTISYIHAFWQPINLVLRYTVLGWFVVFCSIKLHNSTVQNDDMTYIFPTLICHCNLRFQITAIFSLSYKFSLSLIKLKSK